MACVYTYKGKTYTYLEIVKELQSEQNYSDKEMNQLLNTSDLIQKFESMADLTNYTGGAYGADTFWDIIGRTFGTKNHVHFRGSDNSNLSKKLRDLGVKAKIVEDKKLDLGYEQLEQIYGRKFEKSLANDLKARNYFQIINSDAVYAIGKLDQARVNVSGGTAASIDMAKKFKKPIYVYDLNSFGWFRFNGVEFIPTSTPTLTKNFAGIGTRDIELYDKKVNGEYVPNPTYVGDEASLKAQEAIKDVYEKTAQALTVAADSRLVTLPQGVSVVSEPYGVVTKETNPNLDFTAKVLSVITPQILKQAYKENAAAYANWMFNFGLRWTRKANAKAPIKIKSWGAVEGKEFYAYDTLDQNGNPLPSMQELAPIIEMLENELGIDMSNYDSIIGNIYLPGEAIATHRDTTEAESARNYPVVVYTLGNNSGINIYENEQYPGKLSTAQNKKVEINTKNGTIYTFGLDGKGRFEVAHDTPKNVSRDVKYPPITLPDGRVIENYTITLTFRRAQEVGGDTGIPTSPARNNTAEVEKPLKQINIYSGDKNGFESLSNLNNGPVTTPLGTFPTVEHAYQFFKAVFAGNTKVANSIKNAKTGYEAQQLGTKKSLPMTAEQSARWDLVSTNVLREIMGLAFDQNPKQLALLKSTGNAELTHKDPAGKANLKKWEKVFPAILSSIRDGETLEAPTLASIFSSAGQEFKAPWEDEEFKEKKGNVRLVFNNTPGQAKAVLDGYGFDEKNDGATNARNMLTVIADASDSPIFQGLSKLLLKIDSRFNTLNNVNFVLGEENKYETKTATITLNIKDAELVQNFQYVLLHELVHHFTVGKLLDGSEQSTFVRNRIRRFITTLEAELTTYAAGIVGKEEAEKLPELLRQLREAAAKNEAPSFTFPSELSRSLVNGLTDEFEFLAHLLNDQTFQKFANTYKDADGRSLGRSVLDMIKAIFNNFKKALGFKVVEDSILDEGLDAALQVLQNFQSDIVATDEYKYYGQSIVVALNAKGEGIDIPDLKRRSSETQIAFLNRKAKILDAYNANPNIDPQSPDTPFRGTKTALPEKSYDPNDKYIIKYLPNGTPVYANELQKQAIDASVEHLLDTTPFEEPEYEAPVDQEDELWQLKDRQQRELIHNSYLISGSGGTGKTASVFAAIKAFAHEAKISVNNIFFAAPTHNAVKELQAAIDDKSVAEDNVSTVASLLGTKVIYEEGVEKFQPIPLSELKAKYAKTGILPAIFTADYIVLDEVSMFGQETINLLLQRLEERKKVTGKDMPKFLLMGDYKQIPPVDAATKRNFTIDRDSLFINLRLRPEKSTLLTQVMRTDNPDILGLLQLYINNIDKANELISKIYEYDQETGQISSFQKIVPANPNNLKLRKDSLNIKYHYDQDSFLQMFVNALQEDPTNVRQAVIVNYNAYTRPETQTLINKIRKSLFGEDAKNDYNVGELLIASNPLKISDTKTIQNNERLMVLDVTPIQFKKRYSNEYGDTYIINTTGYKLHVKDAYGEDFTIEVPNRSFVTEAFKEYNKAKRGYVYKGEVIPYGLYVNEIKADIGALNYGYVVNTHKVQGSTYNNVFVDEGNILKHADIEGYKPINQFLYTAFSRAKHKLHIYNVENPIQKASVFTEEITSPTLGLPGISTLKSGLTKGAAAIAAKLIKPVPTSSRIVVPEIERLKAADYQEHQIINLAKQITKIYNDPTLTDEQKTQKITENRAKINYLREQVSEQLTNWSIQKLVEIADQAFNSMDQVFSKPNPDIFEVSSVAETYLFFSDLLNVALNNYGESAIDPTLLANLELLQKDAESRRNKLTNLLQETTQVFIVDKTGVSYSKDELYKNNQTSSWLTKYLGGYKSDVKIINAVSVILTKALDRIKLRSDDLKKRDEENLSKFLTKFKFSDILRTEKTTTRLGEQRTTTQYRTRYLNEYYNARTQVFKRAASRLKKLAVVTASDMAKKKSEIKKALDAIEFSVDIRFLFPEEYNKLRNKTYLPSNAPEIYIAQLKDILKEQFSDLGQGYIDKRLDEILTQANAKFHDYLESENAYKLSLEAQSYSPEEIQARLQDYQAYNNPMLWLDEYKDLEIGGHKYYFNTPKLSTLDENGKEQYVKDGEYDATKKFVKLRHADTYLVTKAKRVHNGKNLGFYDEEFLQMEKDHFEAPAGAITKMSFLDWAINLEREYAKMYPSYLRKGRMYYQMADVEKDLEDIWDEATLKGKVSLLFPIFYEKLLVPVSKKISATSVANKIDSLTSTYKRNVRSMNYDNSLNKAGKGDLRQLNPEKYFKAIRESALHYSEMTNIETNIRLAQMLYDIPGGVTFIQREGRMGTGEIIKEFGNPIQFKVNELNSTSDKEMLLDTISALMYGGDLKSPDKKPKLAISSSGKAYQMTVKESMEIKRLEKDLKAMQKTKERLDSFKQMSFAEKTKVLKDMKFIKNDAKPSITWVTQQGKAISELATETETKIQEKQAKIDELKTSRYISPGNILNLETFKYYLSLNFLGWNPTGRIPDILQNGIFGNFIAGAQGVDFTISDFSKAVLYIMPSYGISNLANISTMYALITGQWWLAALSYGMSITYNGTSLLGAMTNALTKIATDEAKETKLKLLMQRYKVFETSRNLSDSELISTFKENIKFLKPGTLLSKTEEINRGITVLSKLYAHKIKDLKGETRSFIDGYYVDSKGELQWDTSQFPPIDVEMESELIGRMTGIINEVHGNYSSTTPTKLDANKLAGFALLFRKFVVETIDSITAGFISNEPKYNGLSKKHYIGTLTLLRRTVNSIAQTETGGLELKKYEGAAALKFVGQVGSAAIMYYALSSLHEYVKNLIQQVQGAGGDDDEELSEEIRRLVWLENLLNMTYTNQIQFIDPTKWKGKTAINNFHPALKVIDQVTQVYDDYQKIRIGTGSALLEANGDLMSAEEADAMSLRELRSRRIPLTYKYFNWKTGKWEEGEYEELGKWQDPKKLEKYYEEEEKGIEGKMPQKQKYYGKSRIMTDLYPLFPYLHTINSTLNTEEEQFLQE